MSRTPPGWALGIGLAAWYAALALGSLALLRRRRPRLALERRRPVLAGGGGLARLTDRLQRRLQRILSRSEGLGARVGAALEAAAVDRPVADFLILVGGAATAVAAVGLVLAGPAAALLMALLVPAVVAALLRMKAARRRAGFADQLEDSLQLLSSSLRAGHSLLRAVDSVAAEAEEPTAREFTRVVNETRLGRDLGPALTDVAARMASQDFEWVSQAVAIHREVGGDLAEVLDAVGGTIRERGQIRRQVKSLAAEGKLSAIVLIVLPFGVVGFLALANPGYLAKFTQSVVGYGMLGACVVLLTIGILWLRKVVQITF